MQVFHEPGRAPIKAWVDGVPVEDAARKQLENVAKMPFIYKHVAAMPDVHWGMGATVGSVIATQGAVIPAAVGVDIGCGMIAAKTGLRAEQLPDNLHGVREAIEKRVPHGRTNNGGPGDRGAWGDTTPTLAQLSWEALDTRFKDIMDKHPKLQGRHATYYSNTLHHLGTLGTGNHFIEVCLDESDDVWVMLHSGSRGIGNRIGQYFIDLAKEDMKKWFITLPDQDLAYLPDGSDHFNDYVEAVGWAQDYAAENRACMLSSVWDALEDAGLPVQMSDGDIQAVNCHHNYVDRESHFGKNVIVTRKGAVRAREGDLGIIPGSMGARSYIVRGKGNPESFMSCSHGAGRAMSRGAAKKRFTLEDHALATEGVECRKDADVIDETPGAYKPIDAVMAAQTDLVDIVHELKQVVCVKG